jgi:hypothetical protein
MHPPHAPQTSGPESIEAEVRANIVCQPLVPGAMHVASVADLALPEAFVRRIADRVIRSSFEERHRAVFEDRPGRAGVGGPMIIDREIRPDLRGYRPALVPCDDAWPDRFPRDDDDPALRSAAADVASRLAADGLPAIFVRIVSRLAHVLRPASPGSRVDILRRTGLPTDLLSCFEIDSKPLFDRAMACIDGASATSIDALAAQAVFRWRATLPGFRAGDDAGSQGTSLVRMQMTRPDHWTIPGAGAAQAGGPGSGDNFDLLLHLSRAMPDALFVALIDAPHVSELSAALERSGCAGRVRVVAAGQPVSQWAQDNLKPGLDGVGARAALLPRFASRAEDGAKMDAGDTGALVSGLGEHGVKPGHSPLHFQGGNVLVVERPSTKGRVALIGEAEIWRNVGLGLTPAQAEGALREELGVEESLVLPAVGFHLDTELSARRVGDGVVVFVSDDDAGARLIVAAAIRALAGAGVLPPAEARALRTFLERRNDEQLVARLGGFLGHACDPMGNLAASAAEVFRDGPADFAPANAMRVLTALDVLAARTPRPWEPSMHPHAQAYMRSVRRLNEDRALMNKALASAGFRVIKIPSLTMGDRSASVINMVQLPDRVLVPVRGGFMQPLDDAGLRGIAREVGPDVGVVGIPAAESERRGGAVHCSVSVFPDQPAAGAGSNPNVHRI